VSISPHLSPAKDPSGCCNPAMSARAQQVQEGARGGCLKPEKNTCYRSVDFHCLTHYLTYYLCNQLQLQCLPPTPSPGHGLVQCLQ